MDMKTLILLSILLILISLFLVLCFECPIKEYQLTKEMEKANYCNIDPDCEEINPKLCFYRTYLDYPFLVNENEKERIENMIKVFEKDCKETLGKCGWEPLPGLNVTLIYICENKKCVSKSVNQDI